MALAMLDAGRWGNTVLAVSQLLDEALRADLGPALGALVARLETLAADTRDVTHLLGALPPWPRCCVTATCAAPIPGRWPRWPG